MRLPLGAIPRELVEIAGFGEIALALGADITIRDNEINNVGINHSTPIVGIYILDGEAVSIQRNRLRDNGVIAGPDSPIPLGRTGAILLGTVRPGIDLVAPFGERATPARMALRRSSSRTMSPSPRRTGVDRGGSRPMSFAATSSPLTAATAFGRSRSARRRPGSRRDECRQERAGGTHG